MAKKAKKSSTRATSSRNVTKEQQNELALASTNALQEYAATIETRMPLFSGAKVVSAKSSHEYQTIPQGAVVGFFGNEGNKTLAALAEAAQKGDVKKVDALVTRITKANVESFGTADNKGRGVAGVPNYAELRYRTKTISFGLFADKPSSIEVRTFPYNGGKLYDADFKLVNFPASDGAKKLECLLIKRDPVLTQLERDILSKVPREQTESSIGVEAAFTGAVLKMVVKTAKKVGKAVVDGVKKAVDWVTRNKTTTVHTIDIVTLIGDCPLIPGPVGVKKIDTNSSAADLLAARRAAMTQSAEDTLAGR